MKRPHKPVVHPVLDGRFDPAHVGLHVPNCELFGGTSKYKESGLLAKWYCTTNF